MPKKIQGREDRRRNCVGCDLPKPHCCCLHLIFSNLIFGLGLLALLFAWIGEAGGPIILNLSTNHLFHDAIALMIAAVFLRRKW